MSDRDLSIIEHLQNIAVGAAFLVILYVLCHAAGLL